jgi:hypothetical protein
MKSFPMLVLLSAFLTTNIAHAQTTIYIPAQVTMNSQGYNTPADNLNALAELKQKNPGVKVKMGKIVLPPGDDGTIYCRTYFPIKPGSAVSFGGYVNAALFSELKQADLYSENDGRALSIQFETIDFTSFGEGKWMFKASLSVDDKAVQTFSYQHPFELSFMAAKACGAVTRALAPGVQAFLKSIYTDARFQELLASSQAEGAKPVAPEVQQAAEPALVVQPDVTSVPAK